MSLTTQLSTTRSLHVLRDGLVGLVEWVSHVDNLAAWLVAVVAGMGAVGWLLRKIRRAYVAAKPWVARAKAVVELAEYELQHNGGGSIKDGVAQIIPMRGEITAIQAAATDLGDKFSIHLVQAAARDTRLTSLEAAVIYLCEGSTALDDMAEALPIIARSTPNKRDARDDTPGP